MVQQVSPQIARRFSSGIEQTLNVQIQKMLKTPLNFHRGLGESDVNPPVHSRSRDGDTLQLFVKKQMINPIQTNHLLGPQFWKRNYCNEPAKEWPYAKENIDFTSVQRTISPVKN
jgi:hypothetical protein